MCGRKEKERREKKEKTLSTLRPLSSTLCMFLGWFLTNVLSKTAVVLHEKDEAVRCDLIAELATM